MDDTNAPILLLAPLPEEAAVLRRRLEESHRIAPPGAPPTWRGRLAGRRVVLTVTGDGERRARLGAAQILERLTTEGRRPAAVIGFGVAGGLSPELEVGDVVASRSLRAVEDLPTAGEAPAPNAQAGQQQVEHGKAGREQAGKGHAGQGPPADPDTLQPSPELLAAAVAAGARPGTVLTESHLADTPERKWQLLRRARGSAEDPRAEDEPGSTGETPHHPPAVVDLESIYYARVAAAQGLPWLILRAVSDTAGEVLPAYFEASRDEGGSVQRVRVALHALARPWTVPALLRIARRVRRCSRVLAGCLEGVVKRGLPAAEHPDPVREGRPD